MTSAPFFAHAFYSPNPASANNVGSVLLLAAGTRIRHMRATGSMTHLPYPNNVAGDDGIFFGLVGIFPGSSPGVPSVANAANWETGFWGRPSITATEEILATGGGAVPYRRLYFDVEFDCALGDGGTAGVIYVGFQALYVDVNHSLPLVAASVSIWGYTP